MTEGRVAGDPGTRGDLTIADRVVDKIASRAALDISGVIAGGSGLDKMVGRRLPKVTTNTRGAQTRIGIDIAVVWPGSASEAAGQVRSAVTKAVTELVGLKVLAVDVAVTEFEAARSGNRGRVL